MSTPDVTYCHKAIAPDGFNSEWQAPWRVSQWLVQHQWSLRRVKCTQKLLLIGGDCIRRMLTNKSDMHSSFEAERPCRKMLSLISCFVGGRGQYIHLTQWWLGANKMGGFPQCWLNTVDPLSKWQSVGDSNLECPLAALTKLQCQYIP